MKSQKGITLTSLVIYIIVVLIVVGILGVISANFQGNMKEIYAEGTNNIEIDKFNVYFLKDVKKQGNEITSTLNNENEIIFTIGNKYTFNSNDECIYLNDSIKIAENIEKCEFSSKLENEKTIITVIIKAINGEEKTIEYVLDGQVILNNSYKESDYTDYVPRDWNRLYLNNQNPVHVELKDNIVKIVPIPKGFVVSGAETENTIEDGLVIYEMTEEEKKNIDWADSQNLEIAKENYNQFVWIPVEEIFTTSYINESNYIEPINLTWYDGTTGYVYDSQNELDYYYGNNTYKFENDFSYSSHYNEMVSSVNKYNGFFIGRYETTIDENNNIGSKSNTTVLTSDKVFNGNYYRWWGLYYYQRNNNVEGNGKYIQTSMIWGQQWDTMLDFLGQKQFDIIEITQTEVLKSGQLVNDNLKDIINNIYDLRGNTIEWTAERSDAARRTCRSKNFRENDAYTPNVRHDIYAPNEGYNDLGTRMTLYIK